MQNPSNVVMTVTYEFGDGVTKISRDILESDFDENRVAHIVFPGGIEVWATDSPDVDLNQFANPQTECTCTCSGTTSTGCTCQTIWACESCDGKCSVFMCGETCCSSTCR